MSNLRYRPEIDGLRTVAVLPVVLFHAHISGFAGGFIGVDIFFVISGYLITTILYREIAAGRFRLVHFYERRARRLLPPLFVVLILSSIAAWLLFPPAVFQHYGQSLLATVTFSSNIYWMVRVLDYFAAGTDPLLHTWSLSVEEQFYIIFPLLLGLWFLRGHARRVAIVIAVICMASLAALLWLQDRAPTAAFFSLPTRAWELGAGGLCAMVLINGPWRHPGQGLLSLCALGAIGGLVVGLDAVQAAFGFYSPQIIAVAATVLLVLNQREDTWVNQFLSLKPMVYIGLLSYNIYLFHQPALVFYKVIRPEAAIWELIVVFAAIGIAAWLTYITVDARFRKIRSAPDAAAWRVIWGLKGYVLASGAFVALGAVIHVTDGAKGRLALENRPSTYFELASKNPRFATGLDGESCQTRCRVHQAQGRDTLLLFGDSHANDYRLTFAEYAAARGASADMIINPGCVVNAELARCASGYALAQQAIAQDADLALLMVVVSPPQTEALAAQQIREIAQMATLAAQNDVVLIVALPRLQLSEHPIFAAMQGRTDRITGSVDAEIQNSWQDKLAAMPAVSIFDQTRHIISLGCGAVACFDGHQTDGSPLYRDTNHLTRFGATRVFPAIATLYDQRLDDKTP